MFFVVLIVNASIKEAVFCPFLAQNCGFVQQLCAHKGHISHG